MNNTPLALTELPPVAELKCHDNHLIDSTEYQQIIDDSRKNGLSQLPTHLTHLGGAVGLVDRSVLNGLPSRLTYLICADGICGTPPELEA